MLISKVLDEAGSGERAAAEPTGLTDYQTASELFDLMTRNSHFDSTDDDSLTARDLVLLYKNIDIGTKLMNDATGVNIKKPNQYVETIIYNDERDSESDLSEIYSNDDIHNVFMVNQERLDMFNGNSLENLLCYKFGGLEIQTSELSTEYDKHFLFKNPYIKNQLNNINTMTNSSEFDTIFPTSLLDYICCKRLEDNYNFYMDNIIQYVQNTIEQLKRISNGDYLTDRAKEKWREVNSKQEENNTKVLATSTSIPLHVECKRAGTVTWDDIVHSEMDVRSLSKILEKKIVVEIPKLICGSYQLSSKRCADNLIISCQREQQKIAKKSRESRVEVVLQLQRSQSGQVMSNISSIMILHTSSALPDIRRNEILPAPYHEETDEGCLSTQGSKELTVTVIEISKDSDVVDTELDAKITPAETVDQQAEEYEESQNGVSVVETNDYPISDRHPSCDIVSCLHSSESSIAFREFIENPVFPICSHETAYNEISPDELRISMQRLNMQTSVLDETGEDLMSQSTTKRKSPVRARIKSPYENKSFSMEEKKRKRLLEIRERREKKKLALGENCKISKHKYGKSAILPQASSSVTKLSITNKSFYNSIYGQSQYMENKTAKIRKSPRNNMPPPELTPVELSRKEYLESPMLTPEKNNKKYTNRSYYLDDAETEMMHMQMKLNGNNDTEITCSASNSVVSNEFNEKLDLLNHLNSPVDTNFGNENDYRAAANPESLVEVSCSGDESLLVLPLAEFPARANTATETQLISNKSASTNDCRKSIDQLYNLIKQFGKANATAEVSLTKSKVGIDIDTSDGAGGGSSIQGSDSGTSVKHHITSSNHSGFSADKNNAVTSKSNKNQAAVEPKVIMSAKLQSPKIDVNKKIKDSKRSTTSPSLKSVPDNPLKAISQLLHEFENVQKTRQRPAPAPGAKPLKRVEAVPNDIKSISRQPSYKKRSPRLEQHLKDNDPERKVTPIYHNNLKDKRTRPTLPTEQSQISNQQNHTDDKNVDKITKKKIADIIDEAKEARGEAVRGPPKLNSRLHSLAQPKKCYVQAHHEEYQNRYGRNVLAERLHKLAGAAASPAFPTDRPVVNSTFRNRVKKYGTEATSVATVKQPASLVPHIGRGARNLSHRSASSSPNRPHPWQTPGVYKYGVPGAPDAIKKMVAVESYVKSHYGRSPVPSPSRELLLSGHKSRAPFVPHDLELASMASSSVPEEAKELGHTLHRMVDCMVGKPPSALTALAECVESTSKPSTSELSEGVQSSAAPRSESDYRLNLLEDTDLRTAVETIADSNKDEPDENVCACPNTPASKSALDLQPFNSTTELQKLETALYSQISGAFQKRLRIKNLTLTPKQSMQQVFLVQSGDARPLLVKSTVSNLNLNKCGTESLRELKVVPVLSNSYLDLTFTQIPLQIATVGYSFSEYQTSRNAASLEANLLEAPSIESSKRAANSASTSQANFLEVHRSENSEDTVNKVYPSDASKQCFKEVLLNPPTETCTPIDVVKKFVAESLAVMVKNIISQDINSQMPVETNKAESCNESHYVLETVSEKQNITDNSVKTSVEEAPNPVKEEKIKKEIKTAEISSDPTSNVDYTTSLDMLVGILNEIQKITCQNQMVNDYVNCTDLETKQKGPNTVEKIDRDTAVDIISISSLDNLRQLESNGSIYSFYISNNDISENCEDVVTEDEIIATGIIQEKAGTVPPNNDDVHKEAGNMATEVLKPPSFDKEVSANMCEYADTCTDVPSCLVPLAVNHSTNVTSSAIGVISQPSSILSFSDYQNTMISSPSTKTIIERPQIEMKHNSELISRDKTDFNKKCLKRSFSLIHRCKDVKNGRSVIARSELRKYCVKNIDFDPLTQIKRDILVTVYSILVLTVFAALSFPELIMFQ